MRSYSDFDKAMHFLTGLFHSKLFEGEAEQERSCPFCEPKENEETGMFEYYNSSIGKYEFLENHVDVASHILREHPQKLFRYSESIDHMLENPIGSIEMSINGWLKVLIDEANLERFENGCSVCGYISQFRGKSELRQHFEHEHKEQLQQIKSILENMQKQ